MTHRGQAENISFQTICAECSLKVYKHCLGSVLLNSVNLGNSMEMHFMKKKKMKKKNSNVSYLNSILL